MTSGDVAMVERLAFRAFPAAIEVERKGWKLRSTPESASRRLNSATTPIGPISDLDGDLGAVEAFYGQRGVDSIVRVLSVSAESIDARLDGRGYGDEAETFVMTIDLDTSDAIVDVAAEPTREWFTCKQLWSGQSKESILSWADRTHQMPGRLGCATLRVGGRPVAIGIAVVEEGWMGVFDVNTEPGKRRRGHGRDLMLGLQSWGRSHGAQQAYLQVQGDNAPALGLYADLGYEPIYRYWYRRRPVAS